MDTHSDPDLTDSTAAISVRCFQLGLDWLSKSTAGVNHFHSTSISSGQKLGSIYDLILNITICTICNCAVISKHK